MSWEWEIRTNTAKLLDRDVAQAPLVFRWLILLVTNKNMLHDLRHFFFFFFFLMFASWCQ